MTFLKEFDLSSALNASEIRKKLSEMQVQKIALSEKLSIEKQGQERVLEAIMYSAESGPILYKKLEQIAQTIKVLEAEISDIDNKIKLAQHSAVDKDPILVSKEIQEFSKSSKPLERVAVAGKLKELLTNITVFADGNCPKSIEIASFINDTSASPAEKSEILRLISSRRVNSDLANPHFLIALRDGLHRLVVPKLDQPDQLQLSVEVDGTYPPQFHGDGAQMFDQLNLGLQASIPGETLNSV